MSHLLCEGSFKEGRTLLISHKAPPTMVTFTVVVKAERRELNCSRRAPGYFTLIGDKAPPAARGSSEVARA